MALQFPYRASMQKYQLVVVQTRSHCLSAASSFVCVCACLVVFNCSNPLVQKWVEWLGCVYAYHFESSYYHQTAQTSHLHGFSQESEDTVLSRITSTFSSAAPGCLFGVSYIIFLLYATESI